MMRFVAVVTPLAVAACSGGADTALPLEWTQTSQAQALHARDYAIFPEQITTGMRSCRPGYGVLQGGAAICPGYDK